jgi:hypothetical protein
MAMATDQVHAPPLFMAAPCGAAVGPRANVNQGQSVVPEIPTQRSP